MGTAPWESLVAAPEIVLVDVRDLVDKEGNDPTLIKSKILHGVAELKLVAGLVIYLMGFNRGRRIADALAEVWLRTNTYV